MVTTKLTSEEELTNLLLKNDTETFFFFLDADYGEKLIAYIAKVGLGGWMKTRKARHIKKR